jgi:hypothetical protein
MKKIFISYARDDYSFAHRLLAGLRNVSVEGWLDSADIAAGTATADAVRSGIQKSSAMLVLVSPNSLRSRWVDFEVGAGLSLGRPVIPILIEGADVEHELPEMLQGIRVLDARNKPIHEVVRDVEEALE